MSTKVKKPIKEKAKGRGEFFSWIFDLAYLGALIFFFSIPANSYMVWHWVGSSLEDPAVQLLSKLPPGIISTGNPDPAPVLLNPSPPPANPSTSESPPAEQQPDCSQSSADDPLKSSDGPVAIAPVPSVAATVAHPAKTFKIIRGKGKPVQFGKGKINGVPFYQTIINLKDPETFLVIGLPNQAPAANSPTRTYGHENFDSLVKHFPGAVVVNGTFFSKDKEERVMGNVVSRGRFLKYSQWENYGTTLGLKSGNEPVMITARSEGQPNWQEHWFSLTCGPRLVKQGEVWLAPDIEGFTDDHVLSIGPRAAIGFPKSKDKLYIITFMNGLSLEQEAKLMKELGCYEAMNLDGGASKALARDGKIVVTPGRALTNVIVVYDTKHPAPEPVVSSWMQFQDSNLAEGI